MNDGTNHGQQDPLSVVIEFVGFGENSKENDLDLVRPKEVVEVVRTFRNGSEMKSDLKMYQFPLREEDYGWRKPRASSRIFHSK